MTGAGQLLHWRGQETTQRLHRSQKALQMNTVIISPKEEKQESRVIRKCLQCSGQGKDPLLPFLSGTSLKSAGISPLQSWWSFPVTQNLFPEDHLTPHTKNSIPEMPFILVDGWRNSNPERLMYLLRILYNRVKWPKLWTRKQEARFLSQWQCWLTARPMEIYIPGPFLSPTVK